jgi:hypothetical protein
MMLDARSSIAYHTTKPTFLQITFSKRKSLTLASVARARPSRGVHRTTFPEKRKVRRWLCRRWLCRQRLTTFSEKKKSSTLTSSSLAPSSTTNHLFRKKEKFDVGFVVVGLVVVGSVVVDYPLFPKKKSLALASVTGARPSRGVRRTTFFEKRKVWRWPQWPELAGR